MKCNWRNVKVKMPPSQTILTYGPRGHRIIDYDGSGGWNFSDGYYDEDEPDDRSSLPTHWMPLPKPPKSKFKRWEDKERNRA